MLEQTRQYSSEIDNKYAYELMINLHTQMVNKPENHGQEDDHPVCIILLWATFIYFIYFILV